MSTGQPQTPPGADKTTHLDWLPPRPVMWLSQGLQWLLGFLAGVVAVAGGVQAVRAWFGGLDLLGFAIGIGVMYLNVALHELGHLLAARRAGMFVVRAQVGWLELVPRRSGWRWRRRLPTLKVDGFVMAFADPDRAMRAQLARFTAGGPAMNLATALACGVIAALSWVSGLALLAATVGGHALLLGLANLLPSHRHHPSDGLTLLRLARGWDEQDPALCLSRLNSLSLKGVTADRLPPDLVAQLLEGPPLQRALHAWYQLHAHLHRADWPAALAVEPVLEQHLAALDPPAREAIGDLERLMRLGLGTARVLAGEGDARGLESLVTDALDWNLPSMRWRCRALEAATRGETAACRGHLARCVAAAEDGIDPALVALERLLATHILALCEARATATPAAPVRA